MLNAEFIPSSEIITSNGGFIFVSRLLDSIPAMKKWDSLQPSMRTGSLKDSSIVRCMLLMMSAGCCDYVDIEDFASDILFKKAAGVIPSQETLRQRLERLSQTDWQPTLDHCVSTLLSSRVITPVKCCGMELIPLDIDVSVLEDTTSSREGVAMSYHQVKGFAPIFCYAGREGYMVANELRPGDQHCEKNAVVFLQRCVKILANAGIAPQRLLLRADSGHDSSDFIKAAHKLGLNYIIKRNSRRECREQLMDSIKFMDEQLNPRPGKTIYRGIRSDKKPKGFTDFPGFMVIEGVERISDPNGQLLLASECHVDSWWTNLPCSVQECVDLYRDHGTSEQFHSELKSDMGIELLPSGKFETNALILGLGALAFDVLRCIGQSALMVQPESRRNKPFRLRLRTVILNFIKFGSKIVDHARKLTFKLGNCFPFLDTLLCIYAKC